MAGGKFSQGFFQRKIEGYLSERVEALGSGVHIYKRWVMEEKKSSLERLIYFFREKEFKGYIRGFLVDSKRLVWEMDPPDLHLIADYVPRVFWRKLREARINLYAVDGLVDYYMGETPEWDTPLTFAEDFLVVNSLFWERFEKAPFKKSPKIRPKGDYYMAFGAFYYRLSYQRHKVGVYRIMYHYYQPIVKELREMKGKEG